MVVAKNFDNVVDKILLYFDWTLGETVDKHVVVILIYNEVRMSGEFFYDTLQASLCCAAVCLEE